MAKVQTLTSSSKKNHKKTFTFRKILKCTLERHYFILSFSEIPKSLVPVVQEILMAKVKNFDLDLCQGHCQYYCHFPCGPSGDYSLSAHKISARSAKKRRRYITFIFSIQLQKLQPPQPTSVYGSPSTHQPRAAVMKMEKDGCRPNYTYEENKISHTGGLKDGLSNGTSLVSQKAFVQMQ